METTYYVNSTEPTKISVLTLTFPKNITAGNWKIMGTEIKASLDGAVQLGYCVEWSDHFDLIDNIINLDTTESSNIVSGYTPLSLHQPGGCWKTLGQHMVTTVSKNNNIVTLQYGIASYYTGKIESTVTVNTSKVQVILQN